MRINKLQFIFVVYSIMIVILSLMPSQGFSDFAFMDKIFHFIMYFLMAFLAMVAFQSLWARILALMFTYGLGFVLEWGQGFMDDRTPSIGDNLANVLGATLGIVVFLLWWKLRNNRIKNEVE